MVTRGPVHWIQGPLGKHRLKSLPLRDSHGEIILVRKYFLILFASVLWSAAISHAASGDDILGLWNNEEKDAIIEIFKYNDKYYGKVYSLTEPNYPAVSKEGIPGSLRLDHNNPNPEKRSGPIIGLLIMNDFVFAGDGAWTGGTVYDPKNGKTYRGKMTLVSLNTLVLRGFVGIPLFGRNATWTRAKGNDAVRLLKHRKLSLQAVKNLIFPAS
jgi:uncharacterized protein (DUF2147 family)